MLLHLRSTLFFIGMSLITLVVVLPIPLLLPLPQPIRYRYLSQWSRMVLWWLKVSCGLSYRVEGREHLPASGAALVMAKHQSAWETLAMQQVLPNQTWVLKRELLWIPFFGWGLAMTAPVAIDRSAGKRALKQVIDEGSNRLRRGIWLIIFPEGTRMAPGERGRYAAGGAMLAAKSGVPVVPVAHNAGCYWPKRGFLKHPGVITLAIGPLITSAGRKAADINADAEAWIETRSQQLFDAECR